MERYDIAIIGSGPAGYVGAIKAARAGAATCVVEKDDIGGVCLNTGCIPTKTLVASAKVLRHIERASDFGISIDGSVEATIEKLYDHKNKVVDTERQGLTNLIQRSGAVIKRGRASFIDNRTIKVSGPSGEEIIFAKNIIIATGSKPASLPFLPYDGVRVVSSEDLLNLKSLPKSILVVGGGYIGCEFASLFSALGVKITVVEAMPHILPGMDKDIATLLAREFKKNNIEIHTNSKIVEAKVNNNVSLTLENGKTLSGDIALVAIGRRPLTDGLDLENAGVATLPTSAITVNNQMMTNVPGIYAVGDVIGNPMLAHVASAECKVAVANTFGNRYMMDYTVIPGAVYTYPEIGSIGISEDQARQMGMDIRIGAVQLRSLGISHATGETAGMAKIITDSISDTIVGIHIIGERAVDIMHEVAVAMFQGTTSSSLSMVIHAHPTFSEIIAEAAQDAHGEAIHKVIKKAA